MNEIRAAVVAYLRRRRLPGTAWAAARCSDLEVLRFAARHWDLGVTITPAHPRRG